MDTRYFYEDESRISEPVKKYIDSIKIPKNFKMKSVKDYYKLLYYFSGKIKLRFKANLIYRGCYNISTRTIKIRKDEIEWAFEKNCHIVLFHELAHAIQEIVNPISLRNYLISAVGKIEHEVEANVTANYLSKKILNVSLLPILLDHDAEFYHQYYLSDFTDEEFDFIESHLELPINTSQIILK